MSGEETIEIVIRITHRLDCPGMISFERIRRDLLNEYRCDGFTVTEVTK